MKTITQFTVALTLAVFSLTGCQAIKAQLAKRDNGSLKYQSSKKLDPIKLPASQASADFVPLYPTPNLGESQIELTNESGKQYALPKPPVVKK